MSVRLSVSLSFYLSDILLTFWTTFVLTPKLKSRSVFLSVFLSVRLSVSLSFGMFFCLSDIMLTFWTSFVFITKLKSWKIFLHPSPPATLDMRTYRAAGQPKILLIFFLKFWYFDFRWWNQGATWQFYWCRERCLFHPSVTFWPPWPSAAKHHEVSTASGSL